MKFVIIPDDGAVSVDGRWISGLDLTGLPDRIHAVSWDGNAGEVQERDGQGRLTANTVITDYTPYQGALDAWEAERQVLDAPPPEPTLEQRRTDVWERVKAERSRRSGGGVLVGVHWFHSDVDSRIQHIRLDAKAKEVMDNGGTVDDVLTVGGQPIHWKTLSNGLVPMTAGLARDVATSIEVLDALAFARGEVLRMQIEASENPESIDISTGWPAIYEGAE